MSLSDGDAFVNGDVVAFQQLERIKVNWRAASAPSNPQPGSQYSDSSDEKLYHRQAGGYKELVQADTPFSDDAEIVIGNNSDMSLKYDEDVNDAVIFGIPVAAKRNLIVCDQADKDVNFTGLITAHAQPVFWFVDLDNDSYLGVGHQADDKPGIWSNGDVHIQYDANGDVVFFGDAGVGENPIVWFYGDDGGVLKWGKINVSSGGAFQIDAEEAGAILRGGIRIIRWTNVSWRYDDDILCEWGDDNDASIEYDETTNDAWIFGVPVSPKRGLIFCDRADVAVDFTSLITASAQPQLHIVDLDNDSVFSWGFYADDVGLLTVPANPLREQILFNSGIGYWSQSDTNKGIGSLIYDTGDDNAAAAPAVGDVATGVTSGVVAKVMSYTTATGTWGGGNATGVIELGACSRDVCFQDDETINFTSGASCVVNHPDGGVGVDGFIENGAFVHNIDPPNDWGALNAALLSTEAGGHIGNCLKVLENGGNNPTAKQAGITLVGGKIYTFSFWHKDIDGTTDNPAWYIYDNDATAFIKATTVETANAAWTQVTYTFEAPAVSTDVEIGFRHSAGIGDADAYYFDEVTLYEITPCCTAVDNLAFDTWYKNNDADIYRQHSDATYTKDGSFYSLKLVVTAAGDYVSWPAGLIALEEWLRQFEGRTCAFGAWVYTSTASHARLRIYDGAYINSDYHSGTPGWEWLEFPITFGATITFMLTRIIGDQAPNVDGSTIIYVSQPMFVLGASIGEGNYRPRQQEFMWGEKAIPSLTYYGLLNQSDIAFTDFNVEAEFDAMVPKGCKLIAVQAEIEDSGSGAGLDVHLELRKNATSGHFFELSVAGKPNDIHAHLSGIQPCDENGDIDIHLDASGASTLDINKFECHGVQVN